MNRKIKIITPTTLLTVIGLVMQLSFKASTNELSSSRPPVSEASIAISREPEEMVLTQRGSGEGLKVTALELEAAMNGGIGLWREKPKYKS